MAVPITIDNLSVTASSNSPAGSDSVTTSTGPDEYFRALSAIVRRGQASSTLASAGSLNLGAVVTGDVITITGTTTITSFGTIDAGIERTLIFSGALTLTHNSTSLILPTGANITTVAGDVFSFRSEGSGNWRCTGSSRDTPLTGAITTVASGAASLGSFSSAELKSALSDETGSGSAVFSDSPTFSGTVNIGGQVLQSKAGNTTLYSTNTTGTVTGGIQCLSNSSVRLGSVTNYPTELVVNNVVKATIATSGVVTLAEPLPIGSGGTGQTTALIPSGTKMLFVQASAPVGWTQVTSSVDNKALRVVSGSGGGTGGSVSFTSAFASHTPAGTNAGTAITIAQMPSHTHTKATGQVHSNDPEPGTSMTVGNSANTLVSGSTGGGATHTHTFTGSAIDLRVQYHDTIICSKD